MAILAAKTPTPPTPALMSDRTVDPRSDDESQRRFEIETADAARALSTRGPCDDATVRRLIREAVLEAFGDRVTGILLFGSRARGDHRPDSDWDVAVLLTDERRGWRDISAAGDVRHRLLDETGEIVDVLPLGPEGLNCTAVSVSIRRSGVLL